MIEYLPWSVQELDRSLDLYRLKKFSILDLEVGGLCNLSCIYCDSPKRDIFSKLDLEQIENVLKKKEILWIFICGLGEPLEKRNKKILINILKLCKKYSVKCSIFSNILNLDNTILEFIEEKILYVLFKLDSLEELKIEKIYRTKKSKKIIKNIGIIEKYVRVFNNKTNIAASIVPIKINKDEILNLVKFCLKRKIFPLIGELEYSGLAIKKYNELSLPNSELLTIKNRIENYMNDKYIVPICPAVIGGIHIDCNNNIIVDKITGLSCNWFWLETPKIKLIDNIKLVCNINDILNRIIEYRNIKLIDVRKMISSIEENPFGGCGGNIKILLKKYISIQKMFLFNQKN